ncbi:hypothetical protein [Bartonella sp. AC331YNZD]|uniref:hypothetical protein n=2 Tax=Bartonella TaxID=773 RepID=UPI0035CF010A
MSSIWDVWHMGCLAYGMFGIWDVWHMGCLAYASVGWLSESFIEGDFITVCFLLLVRGGENGKGIELRGGSGNGSVRSVVNDE